MNHAKNKLATKPGSATDPHIKTHFLTPFVDKICNIQKLIRKKSNEIEFVLSVLSGPKYFFSYYAFPTVFGEMGLENRWGGRGRLLPTSS